MSELGVVQYRVPVEVVPNTGQPSMRPGYPVEIEIITAEVVALAVPREAIFTQDNTDQVFKIKNGHAALTAVELGLEGEEYIEVVAGLEPGDIVIMNPPKEVAAGVKVKQK